MHRWLQARAYQGYARVDLAAMIKKKWLKLLNFSHKTKVSYVDTMIHHARAPFVLYSRLCWYAMITRARKCFWVCVIWKVTSMMSSSVYAYNAHTHCAHNGFRHAFVM